MRDIGEGFVVVLVIIAVVGACVFAYDVLQASGLQERWRAEAELNRAQRIQQEAELLEQKQVGWLMMPGIVAQLTDTALATTLSIIGWIVALCLAVIIVIVLVLLVQDKRKERV